MRKTAKPSYLVDIFHKGFVYGCIGLTVYGFCIAGSRFHNYLTVTRPQRLAAKEQLIKANEEELES